GRWCRGEGWVERWWGCANGGGGKPTQARRRSSRRRRAKAWGLARLARLVKKRSLPALKAFSSSCRNSRRNSRPSTRTGRRKPGRQVIQWVPSSEGPPPGNDAMDVRMMLQGLAPGVEDHGHAEHGAKMPGIGRDGGERLGGDRAGDRVDGSVLREGDLADGRREREDDMKVWHWQQLGLPIREPLHPGQPLAFGTVTVAAGVVSDARCATIIALFDMA